MIQAEIIPNNSHTVSRMPNLDHNNAIDYVLHLITTKAMTSRDYTNHIKTKSRAYFEINEKII